MTNSRLDELDALLAMMLQGDQELTARNVVRESAGLFKHASDITRHPARRDLLKTYQERQRALRDLARKLDKSSKPNLVRRLKRAEERAEQFRRERDLLVVAFRGVIHAVGASGGMAAWVKFFPHYSEAAEELRRLGALPSADVIDLTRNPER